MDMSYVTILVYGGEQLRLYREVRFVHTIRKIDQPRNHPIYAIDQDFGCFQLTSNPHKTKVKIEEVVESPKPNQTNIWKLFFDGSCTKDGVGVGVVLISPEKESINQSCKLDFEATNNVAEYEAFHLGLQLAKSLKVQNLSVFNDLELLVKQVRNLCQTKHPRLRSHQNEVWYTVENIFDALI